MLSAKSSSTIINILYIKIKEHIAYIFSHKYFFTSKSKKCIFLTYFNSTSLGDFGDIEF